MTTRLQVLVEQCEQGENVDLGKILVLQTLDAARSDEIFVQESLSRQEVADAGIAG